MRFDTARELAQALAQRNTAAAGMSSLLHAVSLNPYPAQEQAMVTLAETFAEAERTVQRIVEGCDAREDS